MPIAAAHRVLVQDLVEVCALHLVLHDRQMGYCINEREGRGGGASFLVDHVGPYMSKEQPASLKSDPFLSRELAVVRHMMCLMMVLTSSSGTGVL